MSKKMLVRTTCLDNLNYCRLSEVKRVIERAIDHYGPDASFKVEGQDFDFDFLVIYESEETDSEEKDRLDLEDRMKERRKLQYEQLKGEFGDE